ncbi:YALIA101S04e06128g1_1 [Yarrowia lipolytica]|nr:Cytochrome c mitochondrial import factor CYC2 [Yarrowia lipolytica]SEI33938.1 YALIA101S04e06128g1_1 [Yarrowia lipolytica]
MFRIGLIGLRASRPVLLKPIQRPQLLFRPVSPFTTGRHLFQKDAHNDHPKKDAENKPENDKEQSNEMVKKDTTFDQLPHIPDPKAEALAKKNGYVPAKEWVRESFEMPKTDVRRPHMLKWKALDGHGPKLFALAVILWIIWCAYMVTGRGGNEGGETTLANNAFVKYKIVKKMKISDDVELIEFKGPERSMLQPKYAEYWDGHRMFSVHIRQPDVQVVRSYTPLPVYMMQDVDGKDPLVKIISWDTDYNGFCMIIKKYENGEVAKWIQSLPIDTDVDIRGPFIDAVIPEIPADVKPPRAPMEDMPSRIPADWKYLDVPKPDNLVFFAGGTGIASVLQALLSTNPPRGCVDIHYSVRTRDEVPFERLLYFLQKLGRIRLFMYVDKENKFISSKDIPQPAPLNIKPNTDTTDYNNALEQAAAQKKDKNRQGPVYAYVCGPDGYVNYMAGPRTYDGQGPVKGLLGQKGWTNDNVRKM